MKNLIETLKNRVFLMQLSMSKYIKYIFIGLVALGMLSTFVTSQTSASSGAAYALCLVFNQVRTVIFLLGLTLMIVGGALYAGANIMPSQAKGGFQGYGMGMIVGGVVGVAIAVAAPFVLGLLAGSVSSANQILTQSTGSQVIAGCPNTGGI